LFHNVASKRNGCRIIVVFEVKKAIPDKTFVQRKFIVAGDLAKLTLTVDAGAGADDEYRVELARRLRQQLLDADVGSVKFARLENLPGGGKSDPVSLWTLAVTVAPATITAMIGILQLWLSRHDRAGVTVESAGEKLSVTGTLSSEQKQMVEAFLKRHKSGEKSDD